MTDQFLKDFHKEVSLMRYLYVSLETVPHTFDYSPLKQGITAPERNTIFRVLYSITRYLYLHWVYAKGEFI